MMRRTFVAVLFCVLIGISMFTSCSSDSPRYMYPTEIFTEVNGESSFKVSKENSDWVVSVEDENIAKVKVEEDEIHIHAYKTGETRFVIQNSKNKTVMNCLIRVASAYLILEETLSEITVELIDNSYEQPIKEELNDLYPYSDDANFFFIYELSDGGEFVITSETEEGGASQKGKFMFEDDELVLTYKSGKEERFVVDKIETSEKEGIHALHLIKDYTDYFKKKYPEAGVGLAQRYFVLNGIDW